MPQEPGKAGGHPGRGAAVRPEAGGVVALRLLSMLNAPAPLP